MFKLHPGVLLPHRPVILSPCILEEPVSLKLKRIDVEGRGYAITVVMQATSEPLVLTAWEMVSPVKMREKHDWGNILSQLPRGRSILYLFYLTFI